MSSLGDVRPSGGSGRSPAPPVGRRQLLRLLNDRVARSALRHHFGDEPVPFQCECGTAGCEELVPLRLAGYDAARVSGRPMLAAGHTENAVAVAREANVPTSGFPVASRPANLRT